MKNQSPGKSGLSLYLPPTTQKSFTTESSSQFGDDHCEKMAATDTPRFCRVTSLQSRVASPGGCLATLGYTLGGLIRPELLGINASSHYIKYLNRGDMVPIPDQGHLPDVSTSRSIQTSPTPATNSKNPELNPQMNFKLSKYPLLKLSSI